MLSLDADLLEMSRWRQVTPLNSTPHHPHADAMVAGLGTLVGRISDIDCRYRQETPSPDFSNDNSGLGDSPHDERNAIPHLRPLAAEAMGADGTKLLELLDVHAAPGSDFPRNIVMMVRRAEKVVGVLVLLRHKL